MKTPSFFGVLITVICHLKGIAASRLLCPENNEVDWSFDGTTNGPTRWGERYPACRTFQKQSPIDIITSDTDKSIGPLETHDYDTPLINATIVNAGETVAVLLAADEVPNSIQVGNELHKLVYFVFRFGSNACRGSGHTIDGQRYALELSFLHSAKKTERGDEDATLSILFDEVESDNPFFNPIIEVLPMINFRLDNTPLKSAWNLDRLVSAKIPVFQYEGALAIPPCNQTVQWFIAKEIQTVGRNQLRELRKLHSVEVPIRDRDPTNCKIMDNYRPLQPLNGRVVYESP